LQVEQKKKNISVAERGKGVEVVKLNGRSLPHKQKGRRSSPRGGREGVNLRSRGQKKN